MPAIKTGHAVHDSNCAAAEFARQNAIAGASQAAVKSAEIIFWQTVVASAKSNGLPYAQFGQALRDLGVTSL